MNKLCTLGTTLAAAAALTVTAAPANAAPSSPARPAKACPEETYLTVKSKKVVSYWVPGTHFVDGKGGTITGKVDKAYTKSAALEKGAEASVGWAMLSAKAQVSKTITKTQTVTVGHWYSRNISKNRYGHIRYRIIGYKILFWKMKEQRNCKQKFLDAFYGTFPTGKKGWKYWETKQP